MLHDRFLYDGREQAGFFKLTPKQEFGVRKWAYGEVLRSIRFIGWPLTDQFDGLDPIHHRFHARETSYLSKAIAQEMGWSDRDATRAQDVALYLDQGYGAVRADIIPHEYHSYASAVFIAVDPTMWLPISEAFDQKFRRDAIQAVLYHPWDRLPIESELASIVQAADRLAGIPPYAFFSFAYFNGMRNKIFEELFQYSLPKSDFVKPSQIDLRDPRFVEDFRADAGGNITHTSYMAGFRHSCEKIVFPWLGQNNLLDRAIDYGETTISRIYGVQGSIDPILPQAIEAVPVKLFVAQESLAHLKEYRDANT